MTITAKVIEDSITPAGARLTTLELEYPRFFHAEFMTHRVFSRNAASSRAIPVRKMVSRTMQDPAFFVHVGKNQPGMQAAEEVSPQIKADFEAEWQALGRHVADHVLRWAETLGIHKQVANRALEPWQHIKVIVTATEWENFFKQRSHPDAMPDMRYLSDAIAEARNNSTPVLRYPGEWHLPFVTEKERTDIEKNFLPSLSVARCARISYLNHDGTDPDLSSDVALWLKLLTSNPMHPSPFEHQGVSQEDRRISSRNFIGWSQHRALIEMALILFPAHMFGPIKDNQRFFSQMLTGNYDG